MKYVGTVLSLIGILASTVYFFRLFFNWLRTPVDQTSHVVSSKSVDVGHHRASEEEEPQQFICWHCNEMNLVPDTEHLVQDIQGNESPMFGEHVTRCSYCDMTNMIVLTGLNTHRKVLAGQMAGVKVNNNRIAKYMK